MSGFSASRPIKKEDSAPLGDANDRYKSDEDALADARGYQAARKYPSSIECYGIYFRRIGYHTTIKPGSRTAKSLLIALHGISTAYYEFANTELDSGKTVDHAAIKQHIEDALYWAIEYNNRQKKQHKHFDLLQIKSLFERLESKSAVVPESKKDYNLIMPTTSLAPAAEFENALRTVAKILGRPVATIRAQLGIAEARQEVTALARLTAPVAQPSLAKPSRGLPELPPGLSWPTETYSGSPESNRGGGGIVAYLERVWLRLLRGAPGVVDLPTLRSVDRTAARAVENHYQKKNTDGKPMDLPKHIDIPRKSEVTDRLAAASLNRGDLPARVDWALRNRKWRASQRNTS